MYEIAPESFLGHHLLKDTIMGSTLYCRFQNSLNYTIARCVLDLLSDTFYSHFLQGFTPYHMYSCTTGVSTNGSGESSHSQTGFHVTCVGSTNDTSDQQQLTVMEGSGSTSPCNRTGYSNHNLQLQNKNMPGSS